MIAKNFLFIIRDFTRQANLGFKGYLCFYEKTSRGVALHKNMKIGKKTQLTIQGFLCGLWENLCDLCV